MTNKEAIERLKWVKKRICDITYSPESFEALNLAIKALEGADDVCEKCKYVERSVHEFPCNECAYAYENHFTEVKGGEEE